MNIEIISSSPRDLSVSFRVAKFLENYFKENSEHEIGLIDVRDWNLGLLQNVWTSIEKTPDEFKPLAKRIFAADAFIIVTPEYNGSYTPAFQNLMDHFPKQTRKAFGLVTASPGAMGGMRASQQLLLMVPALFGIASPQLLITPMVDKKFDENNNLIDESFRKNIDLFAQEFLWLAENITAKSEVITG